MKSIPPKLYKQLRQTMLWCGPFDSHDEIKAVFVDARISPWRDSLRKADTPTKRVEAVIALLHNHYNGIEQNALALLLHVLADRLDAGTGCYNQFTALAQAVEDEVEMRRRQV